MKLIQELLEMQQVQESVTFSAAELVKDHPDFPKGLFTGEKWWRKEKQKCLYCDDGKEHYRAYKDPDSGKEYPAQTVDCGYCDGKGETLEHVSDAPEINVSQHNAEAITRILGIGDSDEYVGDVPPEKLPALRRKLIKMKNGDSGLEADSEYEHNPRRVRGKDEHGNDSIQMTGAKMFTGGRSAEQVASYIDRLLELIDFCQKNNAHLTWA